MGRYLNPGTGAFEEALRSEIYVDKTEMIRYLNTVVGTNRKYLSVSRPRRFGKTMAAGVICAYYGRGADSRGLFEKTKLAQSSTVTGGDTSAAPWDQYLGKFNVIRIVMTEFVRSGETTEASLQRMTKRILKDLSRAYPETEYEPDDLAYSMGEFYVDSGVPYVIVIDEWDAIFRSRKEDKEGQTLYLNFLRDWLKDQEYAALVYMTGILPIKKYGEHSALNMFDEYSMTAPMQLAPYTGFTEDEVQRLCSDYRMSYPEIKNWYDGYLVSNKIPIEKRQEYRMGEYKEHQFSLYSPLSVVKAVSTGYIRNFWNSTETFEALAEYIRRDYDGLKDTVALLMDGGRVKVDISTYQNDMTTFHSRDDVLALLIHLGYLGYDSDTEEVFIPNKELMDEFRTATKSREWEGTFRAFEKSRELLHATWAEDAGKVAELLEEAHDRAANQTYNSEKALSYSIQLAYYAAQKYYTTILELDSGKGYADIVYLPSPRYPEKPALLIELKYNEDAVTAMDQIRQRNYPDRLEHYAGNILLVGINYDRDIPADDAGYKHHTCTIERA